MPRASPVFRPALWCITGKTGSDTTASASRSAPSSATPSCATASAVPRPAPAGGPTRARRRIREIFRLSQGKMKQGYDCIVVARTRAAHADYWELKRAFEKTCKKLDLWETQA